MKLKIKDIGPSGREESWTLSSGEVLSILEALKVETRGEAEAKLELRFDLAGDKVVGSGRLEACFGVGCVRCLSPARVQIEEPDLRVTFVAATEEEEDEWEDADIYAFDGEELDLEPLVREALVLAIPIAPLCREDCPGLCGGCGAELSKEPCRCDKGEEAEGWKAALAQLKEPTS